MQRRFLFRFLHSLRFFFSPSNLSARQGRYVNLPCRKRLPAVLFCYLINALAMRKTFGVVLALFVSLFSAAGLVSCGDGGNDGAVEDGSGGVRSVSHEMVDLGLPSGRLWRLVRQLFGGAALGGFPVRPALSKRGFLSIFSRQKEGISPFLKTQQTLMAIWKTAKNVLSLCREKRGNAPCVSPLYRNADYQQFTDRESVHPRATGCTCTSYCPYPRRD